MTHFFRPRTGRTLLAVGVIALLGTTAFAQSPEAMHQQGVALVYSSNVMTDETREGLALLETAVEAGNIDAMITLGELKLYATVVPKDWPRALELFETAADAGDGRGIYQYAMMLMWSQRAPARAEAMLVRAGDMGQSDAWATLAEGAMYGYLGGGRTSRAKFPQYAQRARDVGNQQIEVLDATRHMWGITVRASGPNTIALLEDAADAGNAQAAAFLIRLVRSGNQMNIRRDPAQARGYLETYTPILTDAQVWQLDTSITAEVARHDDDMSALFDQVVANRGMITKGFGADIFAANPNAAIYVLQRSLAEKDYDVGRPDGFIGPRTVRAMNVACRRLAPIASCEDSVLRPDVISAIIDQI